MRPIVTLGTLALGLLAAPLAADAQTADKVARIGILCVGGGCPSLPLEPNPAGRVLMEGLRELGYVEGKNVRFDLRGVGERRDQLPALARVLVRREVDVIVALGASAALEAAKATKATPIVMVSVGNAVELGLVASLGRPGGNVTGLSVPGDKLAAKQLQLLGEAAPGVSRVAVLWNPDSPADRLALKHIEAAARTLGQDARAVEARSARDVEGALSAIARGRASVLVVLEDWAFVTRRREILLFALRNRLPTIASTPAFVAAGGLMSYGESTDDSARRAATFVAKILQGRKPADLPVEEPVRYELTINLPTARAIGLTIPQSLLVQADRVIE